MRFHEVISILKGLNLSITYCADLDNTIYEVHVNVCGILANDVVDKLKPLFPEYTVSYMPNLHYIAICKNQTTKNSY